MNNVVRSVYEEQTEILTGIMRLYCPKGFDCDATFGKGNFWKKIPQPRLKFDICPQCENVIKACSTMLPIISGGIKSIVLDPPFLTYIRQQRTGNGNMIMSKQFSGYWTYGELCEHYQHSISEAYRVLATSGILVFKCQDIIHNHKMHCTHYKVIFWAEIEGFELMDLFILPAKSRLPSPNRKGEQKHARIFHSYFLVFRKTNGRRTGQWDRLAGGEE